MYEDRRTKTLLAQAWRLTRDAALAAMLIAMLLLATFAAGSALAAAPAVAHTAAHAIPAVHRMLADGPNSICPSTTLPCP